jgi:hypothetical protein
MLSSILKRSFEEKWVKPVYPRNQGDIYNVGFLL